MIPSSDSSRRPTEFPAVTVARKHSLDASAKHHPAPRYGTGAIATVSAVLVYFVATAIEIAVIERVRPGEMELTWISDAVLAVAFGFAVFLWLANSDAVTTLVEHLPQSLIPTHICNALIEQTTPALSRDGWQDDRTVVSFVLDARAAGFPSMVSS